MLRPTGVKKGKKLCVEVPSGMEPGDYDVRLAFGEKIIHGALVSEWTIPTREAEIWGT